MAAVTASATCAMMMVIFIDFQGEEEVVMFVVIAVTFSHNLEEIQKSKYLVFPGEKTF